MRWSIVFFALFTARAAFAGPSVDDLLISGRTGEVWTLVETDAKDHPTDLVAQERYIDLLLTAGMPEAALAVAKARVAASPSSADSLYLVGRAVTTAADARKAYEAALVVDPNHARSHMGLGAVLRAYNQADDAEREYLRAVTIDPSLTEAWNGLVAARLMQNDTDGALAAAREAMAQNSKVADGWLTVAVLDSANAEATLVSASKRFSGDPRVWVALAEIRLSNGDGKGASEAAAKAVSLDPARGDAQLAQLFATALAAGTLDSGGYRDLVALQPQEGQDPEGVARSYDAMIVRYPASALVLMSRARVRGRVGDTAGAEDDLKKALKLDSSNVEAMAALGMLYRQLKRPEDAKPWLEFAARARPGDASLAVAAAETLAETGNYAEASQRLALATDTWPMDPRVVLGRAKVLSEGGDRESAYVVIRDAVGRMPSAPLVLALVGAAKDSGRIEEAARILEAIAEQSGDKRWADLAARMRASSAGHDVTTPVPTP